MNVVTIQGTNIQIKEYLGKRVVTFKDIDTVHQRVDGTARKRFNDNRKHFIQDVDFFRVSKGEIQMSEFRTSENVNNNGLTLITESGYLMLVKSFTDELAWRVQRELVNNYFRVRAEPVEDVAVTVTETEPNMYLEASKIVAGCLEGNRPYVLNILRHIIPDIGYEEDAPVVTPQKKVTEVQVQSTKKAKKFAKQGVDIDIPKLLVEMGNQGIFVEMLARKANVSMATVSTWITGEHKPVLQNRINVCVALGKSEDFLTPRRQRNVR